MVHKPLWDLPFYQGCNINKTFERLFVKVEHDEEEEKYLTGG